jgi:HAD superfamily hydrolase (TIGR01509 family)
MTVRAVLFDLDGVLVDSESFSSEASDRILAEVGIAQTPQEKKLVFGRRTIDNYKAAIDARGLKLDPAILVDRKNKLFASLIRGKLKPLPGVLELLGELRDAGLKVAVVSSSPLERVNVSLEEVGLILEFDLVVSGDCCDKGKPDPEPFLFAADRLKVKPRDCVVLEDAEAGVAAGKAAGMKVVAVRSPNTHHQDLSKADAVVDSMEMVNLKLLKGLKNG